MLSEVGVCMLRVPQAAPQAEHLECQVHFVCWREQNGVGQAGALHLKCLCVHRCCEASQLGLLAHCRIALARLLPGPLLDSSRLPPVRGPGLALGGTRGRRSGAKAHVQEHFQ